MKKILKKSLVSILLLGVFIVSLVTLSACNNKEEKMQILDLKNLEYLEEIQKKGDLIFEWLAPYNKLRPTLIVFHGEWLNNSNNSFTMTLDENEYTMYDAENNPTDYVVQKNISGYLDNGLNRDLDYYWLRVAQYNVAIFHWERFADDDTEGISSKLYTVPKMRYRKDDGTYEVVKVPKADLTSIVASLYLKELDGITTGREIRFVGNGIGANLALSVSDLLTTYYHNKLIDNTFLPQRLTLCDPYMQNDDMHLTIPWNKDIDTQKGTMGMINDMLDKVTGVGTVCEMIESKEMKFYTEEVVDEYGVISEVELYKETYAYDVSRKGAAIESLFEEILEKVAYLEMSQSYSLKLSDEYKNYKRLALDWYLYSIIGSDDKSVGYPSSPSGGSQPSTSNWGTRETRPMVNDRKKNNDLSSATASNRGLNFSVSAWTPTVYTRALKGISFSQKKSTSNASSNVHNVQTYNYTEYIMEYFCSENYQKSNQDDYTLICGYIYFDANGDSYINDGLDKGIANATVNFDIKPQSTTSQGTKANFNVVTDESGFYVIRLNDKTVDENGDISEKGYRFNETYTVTLTYLITSPRFVYQPNQASGLFYETVGGQNFSESNVTFELKDYYANAITIKNCLVISENP
ncbi:MAG: hypothetical protein GX242_05535 [Clostridiales bacterium]|nr:hypothetical protein [Clostridiales bacterium]